MKSKGASRFGGESSVRRNLIQSHFVSKDLNLEHVSNGRGAKERHLEMTDRGHCTKMVNEMIFFQSDFTSSAYKINCKCRQLKCGVSLDMLSFRYVSSEVR